MNLKYSVENPTAPMVGFERKQLGFFPTPISDLPNLRQRLGGPRLMIKRDDLSGLAFGGNKTRKLEYLIGDALAQGCDTVITGGAEQSNHCRQTAAACALCGLECHLVLGGSEPATLQGNILLDHLFGAHIHWSGKLRKGENIPELVDELKKRGRRPYVVPYGGSSEIGALGFVEAARELQQQIAALDAPITHVVFASSSGGTQAGLIVGKFLYGATFRLIGIDIDKDESGDASFRSQVEHLVASTARLTGASIPNIRAEVDLRNQYAGAGYGVVGDLERKAITLLAQTEGILVDPVYTGRALGGLIDMIRGGAFDSKDCVLFWHTGGTPALFSYAAEIIENG
jgi:D-cysteine desulfhydrase